MSIKCARVQQVLRRLHTEKQNLTPPPQQVGPTFENAGRGENCPLVNAEYGLYQQIQHSSTSPSLSSLPLPLIARFPESLFRSP